MFQVLSIAFSKLRAPDAVGEPVAAVGDANFTRVLLGCTVKWMNLFPNNSSLLEGSGS